jgi:hypothetical protein
VHACGKLALCGVELDMHIECERVHDECWSDAEKSCNLCGILMCITIVVHTR